MLNTLKSYFIPIHAAGWIFITVAAVTSLILGSIIDILGTIGLIITLFLAFFFRDPKRTTPQRDGLIIAPADGTVTSVSKTTAPTELQMGEDELTKISIDLTLLDVHVNRVPCAGKVTIAQHRAGAAMPTSLSYNKEDDANERHFVKLTTADSTQVGIVQIAGVMVRRIVSDISEGQAVVAGERYGLIRFGSRVDIYLPLSITPLAIVGQRTIAGETVLADLKSHEPVREGVRS